MGSIPESSYTFRLAITGKSNGLVCTAPESLSVDGDAFPQLDRGVDFAESGHTATHHSGCVDTGSWDARRASWPSTPDTGHRSRVHRHDILLVCNHSTVRWGGGLDDRQRDWHHNLRCLPSSVIVLCRPNLDALVPERPATRPASMEKWHHCCRFRGKYSFFGGNCFACNPCAHHRWASLLSPCPTVCRALWIRGGAVGHSCCFDWKWPA
jgi:hypothetical protein